MGLLNNIDPRRIDYNVNFTENWGGIEFDVFACVDPGNPGSRQQNLEPEPTEVIEMEVYVGGEEIDPRDFWIRPWRSTEMVNLCAWLEDCACKEMGA